MKLPVCDAGSSHLIGLDGLNVVGVPGPKEPQAGVPDGAVPDIRISYTFYSCKVYIGNIHFFKIKMTV